MAEGADAAIGLVLIALNNGWIRMMKGECGEQD
jgi:hypothetical protein